MDVCRICLTTDPNMDICQVRIKNCKDGNKSFIDIVLFCLDIKVTEDSKLTTKICTKCYRKILKFNKFKLLALKSDSFLKTNSNIVIHKKNVEIKLEETSVTSDDNCDDNGDQKVLEIKDEPCVKIEDVTTDDHSDDELLSVIKEIKYEFIEEEPKTNDLKRKRGRPKKVKIDNPVAKETRQMCEACGKTFRNLKAHLELHKPTEKLIYTKCTACEKTFKTKRNRDKHFNRKHLGIKKQCKICNKMVTCLKSHHLTIHDPDSLPFECVSCGKKFLSQTKLTEHMYYHTKDRPYECDICNKRFRIKLSLMSHKLSVVLHRLKTCNLADARTERGLRQIKRGAFTWCPICLLPRRGVHNNEKTHLCQFCSKRFFKKYHLQVHLRSHTKEKPYECKECGKFFSSTTTLRNHKMIHLKVKMFSCELCDMSFVKPSYLKMHLISHTKEKRYPCNYCDSTFHRSDHRKRHERTAHQRHLVCATAQEAGTNA